MAGAEQGGQEVVDGAPPPPAQPILPASAGFLEAGVPHGGQGVYWGEAPAQAPPAGAPESHEAVKIEDAAGGVPVTGVSVPMSVGGVAVEGASFYVGDGTARGGPAAGVQPVGVDGTMSGQQPDMNPPPSITLSMTTVAPVTMINASEGLPMGGGLGMIHQHDPQQQPQNSAHQHIQQIGPQAIVISQQQPLLVGPVSLEDLRSAVQQFAVERDWDKFHTPRNLLCALVGEVGELSEIFQWRGEVQPGLVGFTDEEKSHVAQELADILLYLVRLSDICGFDLGQAALNKLQLNAQKYPPELCRGSSAKYPVYSQRQRYETPRHQKLEEESGRKRQRERFTEEQVLAMTQLAERAQWSITAISWEERVKFCEEYGVTKERLSNFFNNRKPKEMKKGRTSRTPILQLNDSSTQATPMTAPLGEEDVKAQMLSMASHSMHLSNLHTLPVQQHLQQLSVVHAHQSQVGDMEHQHMEHQHAMEGVEHAEHQHVQQTGEAQTPHAINPPAPA